MAHGNKNSGGNIALDEDGNQIRDKNGDYMFNAVHTTDWVRAGNTGTLAGAMGGRR